MTAPLREKFANNSFTPLNGSINNSVTSITVTDGSVFPATGNFRLRIEDEILLCTARSSNTLTVVRGYEGSTAASHADLKYVVLVLTAGSLDRWAKDDIASWGASRPPLGVISDGAGGILDASDFTWVNQGGATATDQNGTILLRAPAALGENARVLVRSAPSTPYSVIAAFETFGIQEGIPNFGLVARQSSSGKFFTGSFNTDPLDNIVYAWAAYTFANATTFQSPPILLRADAETVPFGRYIWMRLDDDGTDLDFYGSWDGLDWYLLATHDRDSYMTSGGPDQIGFYANNNGSAAHELVVRLAAWSHS